jgi:hypothetical protein
MGASGALFAGSTAFGASTQYGAGKVNQRVAEINAKLAEQQAVDAELRGIEDARQFGFRVRQVMGAQRAGYAGQGVIVDEGSAAEVVADTARSGELDRLRVLNNAAREAWGYRAKAVDFRNQGRLARFKGNTAAVGTILGGAAEAYKIWG